MILVVNKSRVGHCKKGNSISMYNLFVFFISCTPETSVRDSTTLHLQLYSLCHGKVCLHIYDVMFCGGRGEGAGKSVFFCMARGEGWLSIK